MQHLTQLLVNILPGVLLLSSVMLRTSGSQALQFLGQPQFTAHVSLATPPGSTIYTLLAINSTFHRPNGTRYSLIEQSYDPNLFELNALTGDLVNLQYLPLQSWVLQVQAEAGSESVETELTVTAEPEYKVLPVFEKDKFRFTLSEYTPVGSLFGIVRAFSLDPTSGAGSYGIVSGNAGSDIMISNTTGVLTVARELDYERNPRYTLTIEYSDDTAEARVSVEVTVLDENDNRPYFPVVMYEASVTESAPIGSSVLTVSAVDLDSGMNQVIQYSIVETNSGFEIDSGSGEVIAGTEIDYEQEREHRFTVVASDGGDPVLTSSVIVLVRVMNEDDECPIFQSSYLPITFSPDAVPDVGSVVITLQAVDPDNINSVNYHLGSAPQALSLDHSTGAITLLDNSPNKYTLRVFASGDPLCDSYVDVVINVGSTNTHSPQFNAPCEGTVLENSQPGTLIATLHATDDDIGVYGDITYAFISENTQFSLNYQSGEVTVSEGAMLDYEDKRYYLIDVIARDLSNRQDYCLLNITVLDVNDNAPSFLLYPGYQVRIPENPTVGMFVAQLLAEDADSGSNAVIEYALQGSQDFTIDPASGVITVASEALETEQSYSFTVEASNSNASPALSTTISVIVLVTSDSVRLNQSLYSITICENFQVSMPVLQVSTNGTETALFTLVSGSLYSSNSEDVFTIDPINGNIRVSSQVIPDYEKLPNSKFVFSVTAQGLSADVSSVSSIATVEITVMNYDDNAPDFPSNGQGFSITENSPIGSIVARVPAIDPDSGTNGDIIYSLPFANSLFEITNNGEILTSMEIDAEEVTGLVTIFIDANNPNPVDPDSCSTDLRQSGLAVVTVAVLDLNDNPPSFAASTPHSLSLSEDAPLHMTLTTFSATDEDINSDPSEIYYSLMDSDTQNFMLSENGDLVLVKYLDYEESPIITLSIQVSDGVNTNTTELTINIMNIDDEPPVFTPPSYSTTITENIPLGTTVLQVSADDVDTPSVSYWLTGEAEGRLSVSNTGVITVSGNIDREEFHNGILTFAVVAEGGPTATANVIISITDVNDCAPRFPAIEPMVVPENISPGPGGVHIGTVTAYDSDTGRNGVILYTLKIGGENGFTIDPSTGSINTSMEYDREATPFYTLVVEAMDMGEDVQLSTVATFQVNIGDENDNIPYFPYPYMHTRIFENLEMNTEVFQLPAVDLDEGINAELRFNLLSSEPESDAIFTLDNTTGVIRLLQTLNYESRLERYFTLIFSVDDSVHEEVTYATLEIEVLDRNDHIPAVGVTGTPLGLDIPEDTLEGTVILQLTASDGDSGTNAEIVFAISGGDPDGAFSVTTTGNDAVVTVAHQLDYESKNSYNLVLQVCDLGIPALCSTLLHNITIENIDDVIPSFSQSVYRGSVEENAAPIDSILQVLASDPDFGDQFVFAIESGNVNGRFSINSTTGVLSLNVELDREEQETYTLIITAADQGGVPLSGTGTCIITVSDVDDNSPAFDSQWSVFMLLLDGTLLADQSTDYYFNDPDTTSSFSDCSIVQSQNVGSFFSVNSPQCLLLLNKGNISKNDYSFRVSETDQGIFSTVDINVEHISTSDILVEYLVTVSLAMNSERFLINVYTSFPDTLSTLLKIDTEMLTIISIQNGYHDPINTVDVSFLAKSGSNSYLDPVLIIQTLYTQREMFQSLLGYELSALPTDPCSSEPCSSQASCTPTKTVLPSSVTATSPSFVLVSPVVELGFECACIPGTSGENCSINFNDCYSNPCHFGAQCIDEVNGYRCLCPPGTSGQDCSISSNGCSSDPCQSGANCRDIPGSHSCLCLPGYYGPECQYQYFRTAPTCDTGPCQNGGTCSPGRDSFTCLCPNTHSGPLCETESEPRGCSGNPCYNGSTCTDSTSGPICTCSPGFTGPLCRWPIDNCELEPCLNGGMCATGVYGSYQCYCPSPYTGENCQEIISGCESGPCLNGGRCSDVSDSSDYMCQCKRGYSGDNCEYEVHPVNLCSEDNYPCFTGHCTYGLDSYTCSCPANYSGVNCEIGSPPTTPCDSNPCQHSGECTIVNNDNYICTCSAGFTGSDCETNINDCFSNACVNGVCRDGANGYECECESQQVSGYHCEVWCPSGLSGDFCQIPTTQCSDNTTTTLCQNGGTCVEGTGSEDYSCICPPTHTGPVCEQENTCNSIECFNGGSCGTLDDGGFGCVCTDGYDGDNCQLLTVSFTASHSGNTYRAYSSLHLSAKGRVEFEFSTVDSDGLLLYNTQLQSGESRDFISVEVEGGRLVVGVSHGEDSVRLVPDIWVSDGQWHQVTIDITEKRTSVIVDWCHDLDEDTGTSAGCHLSADTLGGSSFLDLGLPLWLGGAPSPSPAHVSSTSITACVRHVLVNGRLLDLNSHIDQRNSQPGCSQLEDGCSVGQCGVGECVPTWTRALCDCPPLLSGDFCDIGAPSLSFFGSGYARYALTEKGLRQRRQIGAQLRSSYEDTVSLSLRTTHPHGFLFGMYSEDGAEYLYIELESGQVVVHLRLSGETVETELTLPTQTLNDSESHRLVFHRRGNSLSLSVDSNTSFQASLPPGTPLTLETLSSQIYTGGSPFVTVSSWFTGCLQDIRINQITLPTSSVGNEFASVFYEGSSEEGGPEVTEGCSLSPCYQDPCGRGGVCEETSNGSYQCLCSGGERVSGGPCPQEQEVAQFLPYVIAGGSVSVLIVVAAVSLCAGVYMWRRHKKKRTYLVRENKEKMGSQELTEFFVPSQAFIISNEQGGGEEDASEVDWVPIVIKCESEKHSPQTSKAASSKDSPDSKTSHISRISHTSSRANGSEVNKEEKYRFKLPVHQERDDVDGEREEEKEEDIRPNSPAIKAYLEERVGAANDELLSIDSLRNFEEEGSEDSEVDSLSSAYHSNEDEDDEEGYTLERLQAAGPPLSSLAPLLQHVLHSTAEISTQVSPSSTVDTLPTPYTATPYTQTQ